MRIGTSNTVADEQSKHYILLAAGGSSSSSSSANAPKVLQPYWLIVVPLDFPDLTASLYFYEVLAARGGDVYEPSYFQMFQLSPLVVFRRY